METTWSTMEKKEKIMWIKKAAEDQKRYEVRGTSLSSRILQLTELVCKPANNELPSDRGTCVRCAHLLPLPLPQGRK